MILFAVSYLSDSFLYNNDTIIALFRHIADTGRARIKQEETMNNNRKTGNKKATTVCRAYPRKPDAFRQRHRKRFRIRTGFAGSDDAFVRSDQSRQSDMTVKELIERWILLNAPKQKPTTVYKYTFLSERHILPALGDLRICSIDESILNRFLDEKITQGRLTSAEKGLSPAYVKTMMLILNSSLQLAHQWGLCKSIRSQIAFPSGSPATPQVLSISEQIALEKFIMENPDNMTCVGVLLALRAGLRVGEICALSWDAVNFAEKSLMITATTVRDNSPDRRASYIIDRPKTRSSVREIPLSDDIIRLLRGLGAVSSSRFVISDGDSFVNPSTFEARYHRLTEQAGIRRIRFHCLRHTFATRCIEAGMDDKTLCELMGHSNVNITLNTYVHSSIELKRKALTLMHNMLAAKDAPSVSAEHLVQQQTL